MVHPTGGYAKPTGTGAYDIPYATGTGAAHPTIPPYVSAAAPVREAALGLVVVVGLCVGYF
jgi:hypothetical protein